MAGPIPMGGENEGLFVRVEKIQRSGPHNDPTVVEWTPFDSLLAVKSSPLRHLLSFKPNRTRKKKKEKKKKEERRRRLLYKISQTREEEEAEELKQHGEKWRRSKTLILC